MRDRLVGLLVLVAAALADLPVVYAAVATGATPSLTMGTGFLAMGLAWAAGFHVQNKRRPLVIMLASLGVLEGALALLPTASSLLPDAARPWMIASGALSLASMYWIAR